jgi:DNA-binding SARP family transcriptional activator
MEFRLLGPLQVLDGDTPVEIHGTKRKAVLALLVLRANEVVSSDRLIDELWGERLPRNAAAALHSHVSRLRKALGPDVLARREWGYVLRTPPETIDVRRFELLLAQAEPMPAGERAVKLAEALALWRGPTLADLALEPGLQQEIAHLEEVRLSTLERRIDADLEAGRNSELVAELETLIAHHPLREHLRGQLILSLYRAGRQAEALEVYHETRRVLAEELGLDPSPGLRELERAMLRQDPSLALERSITNHDPELLLAGPETRLRPPFRKRRRPLIAGVVLVAAIAAGAAVAAGSFNGEQASKAVFADNLTAADINTKFWDVETFGTGPSVLPGHGGVVLTIPAHATPADATGAIKARMSSYCTLAGEFDIQVDYDLLAWPAANGAAIGMYAAYADLVRKSAPTSEQYVGAVRHLDPPDGAPHRLVATQDTRGTLRIIRSGNQMTELVRHGGGWLQVDAFPNTTPAAVSVLLELWTNAQRFSHRQVEVQLTNFRVNSGSLECPPG